MRLQAGGNINHKVHQVHQVHKANQSNHLRYSEISRLFPYGRKVLLCQIIATKTLPQVRGGQVRNKCQCTARYITLKIYIFALFVLFVPFVVFLFPR